MQPVPTSESCTTCTVLILLLVVVVVAVVVVVVVAVAVVVVLVVVVAVAVVVVLVLVLVFVVVLVASVPLVTFSDALSSLPLGSAHHPIEKNTPSRRPKRLAQQPPPPLMFPPAKCLLHHCWSVRQLGDQRMSWVSPKNEGFTVYRKVCCTCSSGPPTIGQFKTCCSMGSQEFWGAPILRQAPLLSFPPAIRSTFSPILFDADMPWGKLVHGNGNDSTFVW